MHFFQIKNTPLRIRAQRRFVLGIKRIWQIKPVLQLVFINYLTQQIETLAVTKLIAALCQKGA